MTAVRIFTGVRTRYFLRPSPRGGVVKGGVAPTRANEKPLRMFLHRPLSIVNVHQLELAQSVAPKDDCRAARCVRFKREVAPGGRPHVLAPRKPTLSPDLRMTFVAFALRIAITIKERIPSMNTNPTMAKHHSRVRPMFSLSARPIWNATMTAMTIDTRLSDASTR